MKIKKLKDFSRLEKIFDEQFDSDLPLEENTDIYVATEGKKIVGFVVAEQVVMLGQIYVAPKERKESLKITSFLLKYLRKHVATTNVVGAIASESRFEKLYKRFGMQYIKGKFFRRNIDF